MYRYAILFITLSVCLSSSTTAQYIPFGFWKSKNHWKQKQYFKAPNASADDRFGDGVAMWGDTIVIGAPNEDSDQKGVFTSTAGSNDNAVNTGAVYVYRNTGGIWNLEAYIKANNADDNDRFGARVEIYENTIAIAALEEDSNSPLINGCLLYTSPSPRDRG